MMKSCNEAQLGSGARSASETKKKREVTGRAEHVVTLTVREVCNISSSNQG